MDDFYIIGIAIRTTNENGKSRKDIGALWQRFYSEKIFARVHPKLSEDIYALYTDYDSDYRGSFICMIGCKVDSLNSIPNGLVGRFFPAENYKKITARGELPQSVISVWNKIWEDDNELNRSYTTDFEVYDKKSQDTVNAEVEIYIAQKS